MPREKQSGIYVVVNSVTGAFYLGSSVDLDGRMRTHLRDLGKGRHYNSHLQAAFNKYGAAAFTTEAICFVDASELHATETRLLQRVVRRPFCYNVAIDAGAPARGLERSETHRRRLAAANAGQKPSPLAIARSIAARLGKPFSEEHRANLKRAHKGISAETREKMNETHKAWRPSPEHARKFTEAARQANLGRPQSAERRAKIAAALRGRSISDATRAAVSAAQRGRKQSPETVAKRVAAIAATRERKRLEREAAAAFPAT